MGRPTKLTPAIQEKIVTAVRAGNYSEVAARYAGVERSTFFRWMQKGEKAPSGLYRDFCNAVKGAEAEAEVGAVVTLRKAFGTDWRAAGHFLERKFQDRWGRKDRTELTGKDGQDLTFTLSFDRKAPSDAA